MHPGPRRRGHTELTPEPAAITGPGTLAGPSSFLFLFLPLETGLAAALPKMVVKGVT